MRIAAAIVLALGVAVGVAEAQPKADATNPAIEDGSGVQIEYTLTDEGGQVLDTNKGERPLAFVQGRQQIIPGQRDQREDGDH
jgi:hypothetical protein